MNPGAVLLLFFASQSQAVRVALETALRGYFASDAAIAAIVGTKVFFGGVPQEQHDALPTLTFHVISRRSISNLDGDSGHYNARIQIDVRGRDGPQAEGLDYAVRSAINRLRVDSTPVPIFAALFDENGCDLDDKPSGTDSTRTHYRTDLRIQFRDPLI